VVIARKGLNYKAALKVVFSVSVTFIIFFLIFRNIDIKAVKSSISRADLFLFSLAVILSLIEAVFLASFRWRLMLRRLGYKIGFKEALAVVIGSEPVGNFFPLKTGEFFKVLYLRRVRGVPLAKTTLLVLCEQLLNLLSLSIFVVLGGILSLKALLFNFFLINTPIDKHGLRGRAKTICKKISNFFQIEYKNAIKIFKDKQVIFYSFLIFAFELIIVYLLAESLGIFIPAVNILVFVPLVVIVSSLPFTVAGMGIREVSVLFLFAQFGSPEALLSLGLLYSFVEYLLPLLMGLLWVGRFWRGIVFKN
jgi:hypothetical protein